MNSSQNFLGRKSSARLHVLKSLPRTQHNWRANMTGQGVVDLADKKTSWYTHWIAMSCRALRKLPNQMNENLSVDRLLYYSIYQSILYPYSYMIMWYYVVLDCRDVLWFDFMILATMCFYDSLTFFNCDMIIWFYASILLWLYDSTFLWLYGLAIMRLLNCTFI